MTEQMCTLQLYEVEQIRCENTTDDKKNVSN